MHILVEVLMSMGGWAVNRFWDRKTWMRVISEQVTNQFGPKQNFELLGKISEINVLMQLRLRKGKPQ
jgi:hypothetical protein